MPDPPHLARRLDIPAFASGKTTLGVLSAVFTTFGLSLLFQPRRWGATPAYHDLLQLASAQAWGGAFLLSGALMSAACWQFQRRWLIVASLTVAFILTNGWALAFVLRYLTSSDTTPVTWVSWGVYDYLLLRVALSIDFAGADQTAPQPPP